MNILYITFWVVTYPTPHSTLGDICFESDWKRMRLQYLGGLRHNEIQGIYTGEGASDEAKHEAQKLFEEMRTRP